MRERRLTVNKTIVHKMKRRAPARRFFSGTEPRSNAEALQMAYGVCQAHRLLRAITSIPDESLFSLSSVPPRHKALFLCLNCNQRRGPSNDRIRISRNLERNRRRRYRKPYRRKAANIWRRKGQLNEKCAKYPLRS